MQAIVLRNISFQTRLMVIIRGSQVIYDKIIPQMEGFITIFALADLRFLV